MIEKAFEDEAKAINVDFAAVDKIHKDANVYILGQAFLVPTPADYVQPGMAALDQGLLRRRPSEAVAAVHLGRPRPQGADDRKQIESKAA